LILPGDGVGSEILAEANVLECAKLWRQTVTRVGADYPDVELSHMYVDNPAMQLAQAPSSST